MTPAGAPYLTRDDVIVALRELVGALRSGERGARIRIVGGAAIALTINGDRRATVDIDGPLEPADVVLAAAEAIAMRRGWRRDWINDAAAMFLPNGFGTMVAEWITLHDDGTVLVQAATAETLLAMKLHAAQRRGNREAEDLRALLPLCGIESVDRAEALYGAFYAGDEFAPRTAELVRRILESAPIAPSPPDPPRLD